MIRRSLAIGLMISISATFGGDKVKLKILPGPKTILPEELKLAPDAAKGAQHGIIIVSETNRDDDLSSGADVTHHLRAKIFTNEGRDLANVVLPYNAALGTLRTWWGWTVCPDGSLNELGEKELKEQAVVSGSGSEQLSTLKALIPGAAPGCVVDYGYSFAERGKRLLLREELQDQKPIQPLRYRWTPWSVIPAAFRPARTENLAIELKRNESEMLITGRDLPGVVQEPYGPPDKEVGASITFYYIS